MSRFGRGAVALWGGLKPLCVTLYDTQVRAASMVDPRSMERLDRIIAEALTLPKEARCALVVKLLDSIDGADYDQDAFDRWAKEIRKRIQESTQGQSVSCPVSILNSRERRRGRF